MRGVAFHFDGLAHDYATQLDRGSRLAAGLLALGLREGDVVAVLMRNGVPYVDVIHACRIAGIYYCPINWHFMPAEVAGLLRDSGARVLIGDADLIAALGDAVPPGTQVIGVGQADANGGHGTLVDYERWLAVQPSYDGPTVSPRGHMAFTSGTSGRPKGILRFPVPVADAAVQQRKMAEVVRLTMGIRAGSRVLLPAPLYHSAASIFMQQALITAEFVLLQSRFDPENLLAAIQAHRIDTVYLVPIMYVRLLRLPQAVRDRYDLSSLRFVASTGAPCAPEVKRAMIEWFGPVIHETYASSEAGMVTMIDSAQALAKPGSAGLPVLDAIVRIYDSNGRQCAVDEVGFIYVRQPAYPDFTYLHDEAGRRSIERDGLITLGDLGYLDRDGYLFVCDRASDMVISGGVNIYPAEVEHQLLAFPGVADCAVFGVPDDEFGERLHAIVEVSDGAEIDAERLGDWLRDRISSFKVPRTIVLDRLPRDDNGKIAKRRLRDAHWSGRPRRV